MKPGKQKILIIDDEPGIRDQLKWNLKDDYEVVLAADGEDGVRKTRSEKPDIVALDLTLSDGGEDNEGLLVLEEIQLLDPRIKIIIVTGNEQHDLAVMAVKMGAYDFYRKPIDFAEFRVIVERALHLQALESEAFVPTAQDDASAHEMVGSCPAMIDAYDTIKRASRTDATVLIHSESGTGKELVARALHAQSPRRECPFIVINCGAIPENLLESELFGHEKGAFTGAHKMNKGKFELANRGTVFLDEIGELGLSLQVKLLRFLQEREIERVGGREPIELDIRIVAATNKDLEEEIEKGTFRADLFYRLSVISVNLPPLRERGGDILLLANYFLQRFTQEYGSSVSEFTNDTQRLLEEYSWPGNVRELENKIRRAVIMAKKSLIIPADLGLKLRSSNGKLTLREKVEELEAKCVRESLVRSQGNIRRAAEYLGINRTTFYDMLRKYSIDQSKYKQAREV